MKRSPFPSICRLALLVALSTIPLAAQNETGSITGHVTDASGAVVNGATITVTDLGTNFARTVKSGAGGEYSLSSLRPSHYKILVSAPGFKDSVLADLELHTQDALEENIRLTVGSSNESVTVSAESGQIETSAAVTTTVDQHFVENMPLNGRSFQALIALTPGNVTAQTYYTNTGQFSVNGQRTDANYFSIDGVSADVGITQGSDVYLGTAGGGSSQATSNNGGYNNLVSVDDMQEYKIQTSVFDAEYGRTTGAQLAIITRSGTNTFHGTAFEYLRNEVFDANNWFNTYVTPQIPRQAEKQNDFGGVVGGLILHDKLFFFGSYEGLRLRVPQTDIDVVPTSWARSQANSVVAPLLEAYPKPTPKYDITGNWTGQFYAAFSNPSTLNATSVRLDYAPTSKLSLFIRGDDAPSSGSQYGAFNFYTRSTYSTTDANVDTTTAGATYVVSNSKVNDFRFNISHSKGSTVVAPTNFGGATAPSQSYLFQSQPQYNLSDAVFGVFFNDGTADYYVGNDATNHQRQLNFIDTFSWNFRQHDLKFGGDYRRLTPKNGYRPYDLFYDFANVQTLVQTQIPGYSEVDSAETTDLRPAFNDVSFFAEDSWKACPRLTLNYGLRWDIDPPPSDTAGHPLYTVLNVNEPANVALAPKGTPLWATPKADFGPRIGVSYLLRSTPGWETVLRGGWGIYYGLGDEIGAQGTLATPYTSTNFAAGNYPLTPTEAAPLPLSTSPPYGFVYAFDPNLKDPRVYMYSASVQQDLGSTRSVQISYVGNIGQNLLRSELLQPAEGGNSNFSYLTVYFNSDHSNYNSAQIQFKQALSHHVQALFSYTWAHMLDNGSSLALPNPYFNVYNPSLDYGDSDLDQRNAFSNAITYEVPGAKSENGAVKYISQGWAFDSLFRSSSALPVNVSTGVFGAFGMEWNYDAIGQRPNVVSGKPFYLHGAACQAANGGAPCPGGKGFNAAAFTDPSIDVQGDLQRNALRGFGAWQEDIALRRTFPIHEGLNLLFRAEAFNVFNHPLFGNPGTNDGDRNEINNPYFGISSQTLSSSLGGGGADGGFSSLYQIGAPRSLQFALKLQF